MRDENGVIALGHALVHEDLRATGWWADCECGEHFWGYRRADVLERWNAHVDEERENRGIAPDVQKFGGHIPMTKEVWNDIQSYRAAFGEEPIPWPGDEP